MELTVSVPPHLRIGAKPSGRRKLSVRMKRKLERENTERAINRIGQMIDSTDDRIALETCKFVIEQCIGRAPLRDDLQKSSKPTVDNRLQLAIQNLILPRLGEVNVNPAPTVAKPTLELASARTTPQPIVGDPSSRETALSK